MRPNRIHNTSQYTDMLQTLNWSTLEKRHHLPLQNHTPACRNIHNKFAYSIRTHNNINIVILTDYYKPLNILTNTHFPIFVLHGCEFDASFVEFTFSSCQTVSTVLSYIKTASVA